MGENTNLEFTLRGYGKDRLLVIDRANQLALASGAVVSIDGAPGKYRVKTLGARLALTEETAYMTMEKPVLEIELIDQD